MECGYLLFIKSSLENVNDYKKVIIASILISSAFVIMDTFCILTLFPCLQNGQNLLSLYLSTKLIRINAYMPRIDSIFIFIWIFNFMLYLSVIMYYVRNIVSQNFTFKGSNNINTITAILIFVIAIIPKNAFEITFFENNIFKVLSLLIIFGLSIAILLIGFLKKLYNNS